MVITTYVCSKPLYIPLPELIIGGVVY